MILIRLFLFVTGLLGLVGGASAALAEALIAARTIPARTVLTPTDVSFVAGAEADSAYVEAVVGLETLVTIYAGRPVRVADLGPPAIVDRNEIVLLRFRTGALVIETDGRVMDRAALGAGVRVMNMASRQVVVGQVVAPGIVEVGR